MDARPFLLTKLGALPTRLTQAIGNASEREASFKSACYANLRPYYIHGTGCPFSTESMIGISYQHRPGILT